MVQDNFRTGNFVRMAFVAQIHQNIYYQCNRKHEVQQKSEDDVTGRVGVILIR